MLVATALAPALLLGTEDLDVVCRLGRDLVMMLLPNEFRLLLEEHDMLGRFTTTELTRLLQG